MKATLTFLIKFYRNQNEEYQINDKIEIAENSIIAFMPPFSGG